MNDLNVIQSSAGTTMLEVSVGGSPGCCTAEKAKVSYHSILFVGCVLPFSLTSKVRGASLGALTTHLKDSCSSEGCCQDLCWCGDIRDNCRPLFFLFLLKASRMVNMR